MLASIQSSNSTLGAAAFRVPPTNTKPQRQLTTTLAAVVAPFLALYFAFAIVRSCDALRMINLDAPETALQGDTIQLSCFFSLYNPNTSHLHHRQQAHKQAAASSSSSSGSRSEKLKTTSSLLPDEIGKLTPDAGRGLADFESLSGELPEVLYAIKWYKNEREFFRYLAQDWPRKQALTTEGITVDIDKSDNHTVVLKNVSLKSSGLIKCEVSTDAPSFVTKSMERKFFVHSLPNEGPVIELPSKSQTFVANGGGVGGGGGGRASVQKHYNLGEQIELVCSAPESKPAATLDWIINDSLNLSSLSSFALLGDQVPLFEVSRQRFVRLPLVNGSINALTAVPSSQMSPSKTNKANDGPASRAPAYATFELHPNGSLTLANQQQQQHQGKVFAPVSPAAAAAAVTSLDQLTEKSTTRLNFTADANLLKLLGQLTHKSPPLNPQSGWWKNSPGRSKSLVNLPSPSGQASGEDEINSPSKQFTWLRSNAIEVLDGREKLSHEIRGSTKQPLGRTNDPSLPALRQIGARSSGPYLFVANGHEQGAKRKITNKMVLGKNSIDNNRLTIRCVSRVLHLSMSDEIRIWLSNKTTKEVAADAAMTNAQRRQRPVGEAANSGECFSSYKSFRSYVSINFSNK